MYQLSMIFSSPQDKKPSLYMLINLVSVAATQVHGNMIAPIKKNR